MLEVAMPAVVATTAVLPDEAGANESHCGVNRLNS